MTTALAVYAGLVSGFWCMTIFWFVVYVKQHEKAVQREVDRRLDRVLTKIEAMGRRPGERQQPGVTR